MSDAAFLYHVLEDGEWHALAEIHARSTAERGHGLTVHSRAADLRKRGCVVECELRRNGNGRVLSYYRMVVALDELSPPIGTDGSLAGTAADRESSSSASAAAADSLPPVEPTGALRLFFDEHDQATARGAYGDAA